MKLDRAVVLLAVPLAACSVNITDGPFTKTLSRTSVEVRWTTDRPADARVSVGDAPPVTESANGTEHRVVVTSLRAGQIYRLHVSSHALLASAEDDVGYVMPDQLARFQFPDSGEVVSGRVQLKAVASDAAIVVRRADFFARPAGSQEWRPIGSDTAGADDVLNTYAEAPTGDGWSAYWETSAVPEGDYTIRVALTTDIGPIEGTSTVYVDHTPPTPTIIAPKFGDTRSGGIAIEAKGGDGNHATLDVLPELRVIRFPAHPLQQDSFPYDHARGRMMCDPTSEASVLWKYRPVQEHYRQACRGRPDVDACARDRLVHDLARAKGTDKGGTDYGNETGVAALFEFLGLKWQLIQNHAKRAMSVAMLKTFARRGVGHGQEVKGLLIHAHRKSNPGGTGHVMVVTSIDDTPLANGRFRVTLMDPAAGREITVEMTADGEFEYDGQTNFIDSASLFVGPTSDQVAMQPPSTGWRIVPVSAALPQLPDDHFTRIADMTKTPSGWTGHWDTIGLRPGFYWIRVTVTDDKGHSGSDQVEIFLK